MDMLTSVCVHVVKMCVSHNRVELALCVLALRTPVSVVQDRLLHCLMLAAALKP